MRLSTCKHQEILLRSTIRKLFLSLLKRISDIYDAIFTVTFLHAVIRYIFARRHKRNSPRNDTW